MVTEWKDWSFWTQSKLNPNLLETQGGIRPLTINPLFLLLKPSILNSFPVNSAP